MGKHLDLTEEIDIREIISEPFLSYIGKLLVDRKKISDSISLRKSSEILIIEKEGFSLDSVFAGLTEVQLEYFVKYAPMEYKKELVSIFKDQDMMNGVWEIAKAMDDDEGTSKNQDRVKRNIQYIKDNQAVFQF